MIETLQQHRYVLAAVAVILAVGVTILTYPKHASAAITLDTSGVAPLATCNLTRTLSYTVSGTNPVLIVEVVVNALANFVSSVTYGAANLTEANTVSNGFNIQLWYLAAPPVGTQTITVTLSSSKACAFTAISLDGVSQTSPLDAVTNVASSTNSGAGNQPTVTLKTIANNAFITDVVNDTSGSADTMTATSPQTALNTTVFSTGQWGTSYQGPVTPAASTTDSWAGFGASHLWGIIAASWVPFVTAVTAPDDGFMQFN